LLKHLDDLGISYDLHEHKAVFTVAQSHGIEADIEGVHCRNLFLRDKKKQMFLVVAANETEIDLKKLSGLLEAGRFSFGSADRLWEFLGVRPGSVCPYAAMNDKSGAVEIILDQYMMNAARINHHPLINDKTIGVSPADLMRFFESIGKVPRIVDLSAAAPD